MDLLAGMCAGWAVTLAGYGGLAPAAPAPALHGGGCWRGRRSVEMSGDLCWDDFLKMVVPDRPRRPRRPPGSVRVRRRGDRDPRPVAVDTGHGSGGGDGGRGSRREAAAAVAGATRAAPDRRVDAATEAGGGLSMRSRGRPRWLPGVGRRRIPAATKVVATGGRGRLRWRLPSRWAGDGRAVTGARRGSPPSLGCRRGRRRHPWGSARGRPAAGKSRRRSRASSPMRVLSRPSAPRPTPVCLVLSVPRSELSRSSAPLAGAGAPDWRQRRRACPQSKISPTMPSEEEVGVGASAPTDPLLPPDVGKS